MFSMPLLGGFDEKVAGAYLLPPKNKKKKRLSPAITDTAEAAEKEATTLAEIVVQEKQAEFRQRLDSGNLGGGWNPYSQLQ